MHSRVPGAGQRKHRHNSPFGNTLLLLWEKVAQGVDGITWSHGCGHREALQHGPTAPQTQEDEAV